MQTDPNWSNFFFDPVTKKVCPTYSLHVYQQLLLQKNEKLLPKQLPLWNPIVCVFLVEFHIVKVKCLVQEPKTERNPNLGKYIRILTQ